MPIHCAVLAAALATFAQSPHGTFDTTNDLSFQVVDSGFTFSAGSFGAMPNGMAHSQDVITSHAGWQYLAYWNANRHVAVARRMLPAGAWEVAELADYTILGQDSHNTVDFGICPNDGTLHLAFDHHDNPLKRRRSVVGLASAPASFTWSAALFGPVTNVLDPADGPIDKFTYPRFIPTPAGDLQLVYRQFGSGNGRMRIVDYSAASGSWSNNRVFIERTGAHVDPLGGASTARNPYLNRIAYDDQGTLHATWTWRENAAVPYNRDIAYAYSEDGGRVWFNAAHELVADTTLGQAIDKFTPGVTGVTLGAEWGLMNDQGHVVDARGRVHVVMYYKDVPSSVVSYGNNADSHYRHFMLAPTGSWSSTTLVTIGSRPKLLAGANESLVLTYLAPGGDLALDVATARGGFTDWANIVRLPTNIGSSAQADVPRFETSDMLDVFVQNKPLVNGDSSALGIISFDLDGFLSALPVDREQPLHVSVATERDTWVAANAAAGVLHGDEPTLFVHGGAAGVTFVGFALEDVRGGVVENARLRLEVRSAGATFEPALLSARLAAPDVWRELATDWSNRPIGVGGSVAARGSSTHVEFDVTTLVADALARGQRNLTFELSGVRRGPNDWVLLAAREAAAGTAPVLDVDLRNTLLPVADAYVRSGAFASVNFGSESRLHVKDDPNVDYDRRAFLRFELASLVGTGAIESVFLDFVSPVRGELSRTTPYAACAVADDTWGELSVTWNNAPPLGETLDVHFGRDTLRFDVTAAALAALAGDRVLSLGLESRRVGSPRIVHLWSREAALAEHRPRLVVRYAQQ